MLKRRNEPEKKRMKGSKPQVDGDDTKLEVNEMRRVQEK